jgi:small subunit ribosomal protein S6
MKHYEIVFVVHPDQSEQVKSLIEKYQGFVEAEKGKVHRLEDWGRRQLAYPINKLLKAHYVMMNVECTVSALAKIQENFRYNDSILRNLVITRKEAITGKSQILEPPERKGGKSFGNGNGRDRGDRGDRGDRRDSREDRSSKKEDSAPKAESKTESE